MEEKTVTIYSTPTCTYCNQAKEFFREHNIEYKEHDVATDTEKREEMVEKSGQMGVPVILVGDEVMVGFDAEKMKEMLNVE